MNFLEVTKHISDKLDRVIRYTLSNGLTVLLTPYTKVNQINFQLWIKTGSVHEEKYLGSGLSHCLEHCIFLGSKNYKNTGEYSKFVEMRGGADNNAHTSYDNTGFYFTLQDKYLEDGLDVLSDLVFNPLFPINQVKKEKNVILAEMDMEFDDVDVKIQQDFIEKMFLSHPYREPIIGRRDLFAKLTKANLQDYYQHRYSPDNMVLALAGSIDINKTKELVEKYFGQIKKRENSLVVIPEEMAFTSRRYSPTILPIEKPRMKLGFHGVNAFHSDAVALDILDAILSYGQSSWLYKKYINTALLYSIETSNWTPFHKGYFEITSVYNSEEINISSEQILENIHALFSEKKQNNSKELILKGAIKKISLGIYSNFYALNNMNTNIVNNEVQYGYYRWDESYLEHLNNLKWADIERVCQIYLNKNRMIESLYLNKSLKSHLKNSKTKSDIFPTIEIKKDDCKISYLDNGLRLLIQSFSSELIHLILLFKGGLEYETKENNGAFNLMCKLLTQGTNKYQAKEIADFFENKGCIVDTLSGESTFGLSLSFFQQDQKEIYDMVSHLLQASTFSTTELALKKQQLLNDFLVEKESIWEVHTKDFLNKIYGKHVLGEDIRGSVDSLAKINSKTLAELKNQFILSNNCVLGLSGVVDFDLAKMTFSKLKRGDTVPFPLALKITGIKANNSSFKIISKEQTLYRIVFQTAALGHEDTIYLNLLASYFNGLGGPLFQLREMTGEAYQIDCKHLSKRTHGLFIFTFMLGYHSDKNQKWIINTIYSMLKKVNKNKLKDNEITRALESYKGRIWTSMQNLDEQLLQLCRFELIGRGYEFFEKENSFSTEKIKYLKERLVEVVNKYFTDHLLVGVGAKKSEQI